MVSLNICMSRWGEGLSASWSRIGLCFMICLFVHLNSSVLPQKDSSIWHSGQEHSLGVTYARVTIPTLPLINMDLGQVA